MVYFPFEVPADALDPRKPSDSPPLSAESQRGPELLAPGVAAAQGPRGLVQGRALMTRRRVQGVHQFLHLRTATHKAGLLAFFGPEKRTIGCKLVGGRVLFKARSITPG